MAQLAPHGTPKRYQQGCTDGTDGRRCQPCKDAWAEHYRAKRAADREARDAAGPLARATERGRGYGIAGRLEALWAAEAEAERALLEQAPRWRAELEAGDSGHDCPSGHPRQWAGAHTVLVCLECNKRASSPGAQAREADLGQARAERKARSEAVAQRGPTNPDVFALERRKGIMIEELEDYADSGRVRPGDKRVIRRIIQLVEDAETEARLDELIETTQAEIRPRRFWQADPAALIGAALEYDAEGEQLGGDGGESAAEDYQEWQLAPTASGGAVWRMAPLSPYQLEARAQAAGHAEGGSFWADYDANTAAAARASAVHAAQVRQLRPRAASRPDPAEAARQGFSACACGGWADPAKRQVTLTGAWCRNCGAVIRSPLAGKRGDIA